MPFLVDVSRFAPRNRQSFGILGHWGYPLDCNGFHMITACCSLFWKDCPRREDPALGKLKAVTGCSRGSTECVEAMLRFCLEDVSWCSVLECLADRSTSTRPVYRIDGIRWHSKAFRRHHGRWVGIPDLSCFARIRILCRVWKVKPGEIWRNSRNASWSIMIHQKSVWLKLHAVALALNSEKIPRTPVKWSNQTNT